MQCMLHGRHLRILAAMSSLLRAPGSGRKLGFTERQVAVFPCWQPLLLSQGMHWWACDERERRVLCALQEEFYLDTLRAVATAGATARLEVQQDEAAVGEGETR